MQTRIDLSRFESIYDQLDSGHDMRHITTVRDSAIRLAQKYAPNQIEIAYVAATLHDIGLLQGRADHELRGSQQIAADPEFQEKFSSDELALIVEAIREHRASTGNPQSIVAKIVSDADRTPVSTQNGFLRAYYWGLDNLPDLNENQQLLRAAQHITEKYGPGGTGTRTYFPETAAKITTTYQPIREALTKNDLEFLKNLLK